VKQVHRLRGVAGILAVSLVICACGNDRVKVKTAQTNACTVRMAAMAWQATHPGDCPTVAQLIADRELASTTDRLDPWGSPYAIRCDDDVQVVSPGPDKQMGTTDDVTCNSVR